MKNILYTIRKWFDLNLGWMFINGRKQEAWYEYLQDRYGK